MARNIAKEIEEGLQGIISDLDGTGPGLRKRVVEVPDVKQIRKKMGLSQHEFSAGFLLSQRTLQEWEQKRRKPDQTAAVLLRVIEAEPLAVARALGNDTYFRQVLRARQSKHAATRTGRIKAAGKSKSVRTTARG
jgi:putative transcriptional regulator